MLKKEYREALLSLENDTISEVSRDLFENDYDKKRYHLKAQQTVPFSLEKKENGLPTLREQIISILETIKPGQKERLLLYSHCHVMTLQIAIKKNKIVKIKFYFAYFYNLNPSDFKSLIEEILENESYTNQQKFNFLMAKDLAGISSLSIAFSQVLNKL